MRRVTVGDIAQVVSGGTPPRNKPELWGGTIPWVKTGAIDFCTITESNEWITEEGLRSSAARMIPTGTILMAMYGQGKTRGQVAILGIDAAINQACAALLLQKGCDRDFVYQQLAYRYASIRRMSNSGGQDNLNADLVRSIAFPLPDELEQRKIGEVLNTWDRAVRVLEGLIGDRSSRKRGLMQQLLTGRTRFKEFKGEKWRHCHLGDVVQAMSRPVAWDEHELYRLASVRRWCGGVFSREELRGDQIKVKKLQTIRTGDFLISHIQAAYGAMALVPKEFDGARVSELYTILRPKDPKAFDIRILGYLGQTKRMWYMAIQASNGFFAERLRLNFDPEEFLRLPVNIPATLAEQKKIADTMEACDREIELLQKQLGALKEQKRGLMQKLLTGEIRVKV